MLVNPLNIKVPVDMDIVLGVYCIYIYSFLVTTTNLVVGMSLLPVVQHIRSLNA